MRKGCATTFLLFVLSSLAVMATTEQRHAIANGRAHQPDAESRSLSNVFSSDAGLCGKWKQLGHRIEGSSRFEYSGSSISTSADGRTIAIGSPYNSDVEAHAGSVRIFRLRDDVWKPFGGVLSGKSKDDLFGSSIAVSSSGRIIAIGSKGYASDSMKLGRVKVFSYNFQSKSWIKMGNVIIGTIEGQGLGSSIAISADGQTLAVTSAGSGSKTATTLYKHNSIYEKWKQHGEILLEEEPKYTGDGVSVSLSDDGNIVAIGSKQNSKNGKSAGSVRIFEYDYLSETYEQMGTTIYGKNEGDNFGSSISLAGDGNIIAIGSDGYSNNTGCTMIYRYRQKDFDWKMVGNKILGEAKKAYAGTSVSISAEGDVVAVGSIGMNKFGDSSGHTNLYRFDGFVFQWQKVGNSIFGKERDELSGSNIQLSKDGNTVIVAAPMSSLGAKYSGLTRAYAFEPSETCAPTLSPTLNPTKKPTLSPTIFPTHFPTRSPTFHPTASPSNIPTVPSSARPSFSPSKLPSIVPTSLPSSFPTGKPSSLPTNWPSTSPSSFPTGKPSSLPTNLPSTSPSSFPTGRPTVPPTDFPSRGPSVPPTLLPSILPSLQHSLSPTVFESERPTSLPSSLPTSSPSKLLSNSPSNSAIPSSGPTVQPSLHHSSQPTISNRPSTKPSSQPTLNPSISLRPTLRPSEQPTVYHSSSPSMSNNPSFKPSVSRAPSVKPSLIPTIFPTEGHSVSPSVSQSPSMKPSVKASSIPSALPSSFPTLDPTQLHSISPTLSPSSLPSNTPSRSKAPSLTPSYVPSDIPSTLPTIVPSSKPTIELSNKPSFLPSLSPTPRPSISPSSKPTPSPSQQPTPSPSVSTIPTATPTEQPTPTYDGMSALWKFLDRLNGL